MLSHFLRVGPEYIPVLKLHNESIERRAKISDYLDYSSKSSHSVQSSSSVAGGSNSFVREYRILALSPGPASVFNVARRKMREGLVSNVT